MCLIITGKASKVRSTLLNTHGLLADIYTSNPDGIGFMYGSVNGLRIVKTLPKNVADAQAFIRRIPNDDREFAIHFRWTTHGDTDMLNCHPYDVIPGFVAMMHNGVLHTGNSADTRKSDTWHFINDYLSTAVRMAPNLVHDEGFIEMVGEFIGNNRFVFMDGEGRMTIVNEDQGVHHDDMWFSNTYAWKPSRLIPHYQSANRSYKSYKAYSNYGADDEYDDHYSTWTSGVTELHPQERKLSAHDPRWSEDDYDFEADQANSQNDAYAAVDLDPPTRDELSEAMLDADVELLDDWLNVYPAYTLRQLFLHMAPVKNPLTSADDLAEPERSIYHAVFAGDVDDLIKRAQASETSRALLAETLCYYMYWTPLTAKRPVSALPQ